MTAATARRSNYGTTQTIPANTPNYPDHHSPHLHSYPTQAASSSIAGPSGTSLGRNGPAAGAGGAYATHPHAQYQSHQTYQPQPQRSAYYGSNHAQYPPRTAGESWSLQREGDRQVIVIEDTPPPTAHSYNGQYQQQQPAASTSSRAANASSAAGPSHAAKKPRYNGTGPATYANANGAPPSTSSAGPKLNPSPAAYQVNQLAGPSNWGGPSRGASATNPASAPRKAAGHSTKRKYNEVNDPSTANDKNYPSKALACDDKDGHYIIRPDDELGETRRYKIIRLLGQGTFGKVVEAWDRDERCLVAVKIIRAIQKYRDASKVEIKVLNLLRERDPSNINKCIHLIDCFDHRNHICIVTRLLSCSVFDFLKDNNYLSFPLAHIQSFAKQLLTSVAFLHDLGLVHTDLKPENILLVDSDFVSVPYRPTKANPTVKQKRLLKNSSMHLIDFGSATFEEEYHASVVSTRHYRAPEIILGLGWSYPCDVWSIGCILVEFYTGEALFQTHENLEHLAMMEIVFGRLPEGRWGKAAVRSKPEWFNGGTKVNYPQAATSRQSRKYVKAMKPLEQVIPARDVTMSRFLDLLTHLLRWDPADRYTVRDALKHPFFSLEIDDPELKSVGLR